jgi:alpha-beta hydrolase superfamily lysophospholipase
MMLLFLLVVVSLPALQAQQTASAQAPVVAPAATAAQAAAKTEEGEINGARFRIDLPANWNRGGLVMYCHGYQVPNSPPLDLESVAVRALRDVFLSRGYAFAMSHYASQGWAVKEAIEDTEALRRYFVARYGRPRETFVTGHSMGGLLTIATLERYPESYAGAMPLCGPLSPALDFFNSRVFDMVVTFDYFFPGTLGPLDNIRPDDYQKKIAEAVKAQPEKAAMFARRFELAGPDELPNVVGFFLVIVAELRYRLGANPFDNHNTVYSGFGDDAAVNRGVKRFTADPRAQAYLREYYTPTGRIAVPVLTVHTTYDPLVPARDVNYYNVTAGLAGAQNLFVEKFVEAKGHCAISAPRIASAFDALLAWVHEGKRPPAGEIQ